MSTQYSLDHLEAGKHRNTNLIATMNEILDQQKETTTAMTNLVKMLESRANSAQPVQKETGSRAAQFLIYVLFMACAILLAVLVYW